MGKNQRSVSLPKPIMDRIDEIYEANKEILHKWGIDSTTKLVKVIVNYGMEPATEALAELKRQEKERVERQKLKEAKE